MTPIEYAAPVAVVLASLLAGYFMIRAKKGDQKRPPAATYEEIWAEMRLMKKDREDDRADIVKLQEDRTIIGDGFDAIYSGMMRMDTKMPLLPREIEAVEAARKLRSGQFNRKL